jgi:hypothetical protein
MFEKIYLRKWSRRDWLLLPIFAAIALAGIGVGHVYDTNTASVIASIKQDGTTPPSGVG